MKKEVAAYNHCFVCGVNNPIGLKLRFFFDGKKCTTEFSAGENFVGYRGILHGGILAAILDEVMIKSALANELLCVTARMEVKFLSPAPANQKLCFSAEITERRGRAIMTKGIATTVSGAKIAEATALYLKVSPEMEERLKESLQQ